MESEAKVGFNVWVRSTGRKEHGAYHRNAFLQELIYSTNGGRKRAVHNNDADAVVMRNAIAGQGLT